jgi:hypothetical protein
MKDEIHAGARTLHQCGIVDITLEEIHALEVVQVLRFAG